MRRRPPAHRRRTTRLVAVVASILAVAALAWSAGRRIDSPDARTAATAPPQPTVLTAAVEQRSSQQVALRMRTAPVETFAVTGVPVLEGALPVVTDLPIEVGTVVGEGQRLLSVTGRPLLAVAGALAGYRDLRPLDMGPDVAQLEAALVRLGLLEEPADDTYGASTKAAVRELYRRAGAVAIEVAPDGPSEAELESAEREARSAVDAAAAAGDVEAHRAATAEVRQAAAVLTAVRDASGPSVPRDELAVVPHLPMVVDALTARLGRPVAEGKVLVLRSDALVFTGELAAGQASQVRPGQAAAVARSGGSPFLGLVQRVATEPGESGMYAVVVAPGAAIPADLVGIEVVVQVQVLTVDEPVLTVPVAALLAQADGSTVVVRRSHSGREQKVPVEPGRDFDGMVEVRVRAGGLGEGDDVVIGR